MDAISLTPNFITNPDAIIAMSKRYGQTLVPPLT